MKILKYLSVFFSVVLHPLFIPIIGIYLIFHSPTYLNYLLSPEAKKYIMLLIALTTVLLPLIITLLLQLLGTIKSAYLDEQKERTIPYITTIVLYGLTLYLLLKIPLPKAFYAFISAAGISVLLALVINFFWKISAHLIGIGGLVAVIFIISISLEVNLYSWLIGAIIAAGILGSARMILKKHTLAQVVVGFLIGFAVQFIYFLF